MYPFSKDGWEKFSLVLLNYPKCHLISVLKCFIARLTFILKCLKTSCLKNDLSWESSDTCVSKENVMKDPLWSGLLQEAMQEMLSSSYVCVDPPRESRTGKPTKVTLRAAPVQPARFSTTRACLLTGAAAWRETR